MAWATGRPSVVLFDVIGTVFRLDALGAPLVAQGLAEQDIDTLYAAMLRDAFALTLAGTYAPLPEVLAGALAQLRAARGLAPDPGAAEPVQAAMRRLDPYADAADAFRALRAAGIGVHMLSNGAADATRGLLDRAGLADLVDGIHSVEAARRYKPTPAAYLAAIETLDLEPVGAMLVATHAWDCQGAARAGLLAGFVRRGQPWPAVFDAPDVTGETLLDVATIIAAR